MPTLPISDIVERNVAILFAPEERDDARALLLQECGENVPMWRSAGIDRLRCAVLKLSAGDITKLQNAIKFARRDFRDVLMWAGFGDPDSHKSWIPERHR